MCIRDRNKTEHNFGEVVQQQSEKFKCEIQKNTKNLSENLNRINQEVRREINTTKEVVREEVRNISTVNKEESGVNQYGLLWTPNYIDWRC